MSPGEPNCLISLAAQVQGPLAVDLDLAQLAADVLDGHRRVEVQFEQGAAGEVDAASARSVDRGDARRCPADQAPRPRSTKAGL